MFFGEENNSEMFWKIYMPSLLLIYICFISIACQSNEQKLETTLQKCQKLLENDKLSDSVSCYTETESKFNEATEIIAEKRSGSFFVKCAEYSKKGDFEMALLCYEILSSLVPESANAQFNLAVTYLDYAEVDQMGESKLYPNRLLFNKAEDSMEKAIKLNSKDAQFYAVYGKILRKQNKWHRAINQYNKAIEIAPNDPAYRVFLARAKEKVGEDDFAIESYKKAIELDSNLEVAWYNLGILYEKKENFIEAIKCYEKVNELHPNFDDTDERLENLKEKLKPKLDSQEKRNQPVYRMVERPKRQSKP